jgi:hypothetical protein
MLAILIGEGDSDGGHRKSCVCGRDLHVDLWRAIISDLEKLSSVGTNGNIHLCGLAYGKI